jgi:hypothetical protein
MGADDGNADRPRHLAIAGPGGMPAVVRFIRHRGALVGAVVAGLTLLVVVPLGLASLVPRPDPGGVPGGEVAHPLPNPGSDATSPASFSTSGSGLSGPGLSGSGLSGPAASTVPRRTTSSSPVPTSPAAVFAPVTIEAEAPTNVTGGSAWVAAYPGASGGKIVRNLGDWNTAQGPGWLRFNGVTVPADGTYTVTLYNVHIDNSSPRTAVVTVSTGVSVTVSLRGSSACCAASAIKVGLRKGVNTITVGNPADHAPSIDRIVISLP